MRVLSGPKKALHSLAFLPGGAVAAGGIEGVVSVWDAAGRRRIVAADQGRIDCVAASPDGQWLAWVGEGGRVEVKRADGRGQRRRLRRYWEAPEPCAFAPDGRSLFAVGLGYSAWRVSDWEPARYPCSGVRSRPTRCIAVAPDSRAVAAGAFVESNAPRGWTVCVWDTIGGAVRDSFTPPHEFNDALPYTALAYSPDGTLLAGLCRDELRVWVAATGEVVHRSPPAGWLESALAFSPDGRRVATGGTDGLVTLRDTATWGVVAQYDWGLGEVRGVAYSPDGLVLAACGSRGKAVVWDAEP